MRNLFYAILCLATLAVSAQKKIIKRINQEVQQSEYASHMYFLASDEMRGRNTGTVENEIAARYIAERFKSYGVKPLPGQETYMQTVPLVKEVTPTIAEFKVGDSTFILNEDIIFFSSVQGTYAGEVVYVGYGTEEDLKTVDVKGKIVIAKTGDGTPGRRLTQVTLEKQALMTEAGALALIELYRPSRLPWKMILYYFSSDKYKINPDPGNLQAGVSAAWIGDKDGSLLSLFEGADSLKGELVIKGAGNKEIYVPNVLGYVEGTDPQLKDEYIMISAHFDHVGVGKNEEDSIWNGARDNGIGVSNMLTAAEYFGKNPPKRSIIFLACNAEERGLLGSKWYADHPLIPLNKTVFNLNTDSGGYNDITKVTLVGFFRTSMSDQLAASAEAFGLTAIDDPLPEENYYDRSDNVSFAAKGVPAVSFDPGYTEMNEALTKYYHMPADEANTLDFNYLIKYSKAFIYAVTLVGNTSEKIFWTTGDKYEPAGKTLYGIE